MNLFQGATTMLAELIHDPQHKRLLHLAFPKGGEPPGCMMLANSLDADEAVSRDFRYTVEVLSDDASIPLKDVMGKMVTISLVRDDGTLRYFNGYVFEFRFLRTDGGFAFYEMVLKPWLAFLHLRHDCRVFQGLTLAEVCEQVFDNYLERDYRFLMVDELPVATMLVQFQESDHNHLHRRLEAAGLHYWYEHRQDGHTFCLSDNSVLAEPLEGNADVPYQSAAGSQEEDGVRDWSAMRRIAAGHVTVASYDFKKASPDRQDQPSLNKQGAVPAHDVYEYAGAYGYADDEAGTALASLRMKEIDASGQDFRAAGNARNIEPRRSLRLTGHFSGGLHSVLPGAEPTEDKAQRDYLVLAVRHSATNNYQDGRGAESHYHNTFSCMRRDIPWVPGRGFHSAGTRIYGVQTATVVGPEGEEIYTDEYGRIKLQFHWDRLGQSDAASSAFVRVMTGWAGARFGAVSIPRIGQEVVVTFLDGNGDRPLVIGSVYNASHMPPWELPSNRTQSGILTRSTKLGTAENANALRFEDRKGAEELWLHAEKDQRIEVEHDESHWVGNDRKKAVDHDETVEVKHDRTETVGHDEKITVHNNRSERVDHDEQIDIGRNRSESVGGDEKIRIKGKHSERVGRTKDETIVLGKALSVGAVYQVSVGAAMNTSVGLSQTCQVGVSKSTSVGKTYSIDAGDQFVVEVGLASLRLSKDGTITLSGTRIDLEASGPIKIDGKNVDINGGGDSVAGGGGKVPAGDESDVDEPAEEVAPDEGGATDPIGNALVESLAQANWGGGGNQSESIASSNLQTNSGTALRSAGISLPTGTRFLVEPDQLSRLELSSGSINGIDAKLNPSDDALLQSAIDHDNQRTVEEAFLAGKSLAPTIANAARLGLVDSNGNLVQSLASTPGWASNFYRGFNGEDRSVMEGPAPLAETIGSYAGSVADFGLGMIGVTSALQARSDWKAGNYLASAIHGAAAVGEFGTTVLSFGTLSAARQGAKNNVLEALADKEVTNAADSALARIAQEGHAIERHGEKVTNGQLFTRATTGVAPDGSSVLKNGQVVIPPSSTAFNSDLLLAQSDTFIRNNYLDRAIALSAPGAQRVVVEGVDLGLGVGRGFDRILPSLGAVGPLRYNSGLTRATGVYSFDSLTGSWRTVTIYPGK